MHIIDRDEYRRLAEEELRLAQSASQDDVRRAHFLQAGLYFDQVYGGDPCAPARSDPAPFGREQAA